MSDKEKEHLGAQRATEDVTAGSSVSEAASHVEPNRIVIAPLDGEPPMSEPTFDESGDYPSEETLEAIRNWPGWKVNDLFEFVLKAWHWDDLATTNLRQEEWKVCDGEDGDKFLRLATGGWSGNEDIVMALKTNLWALQQWQLSARGGLHVFKYSKIGSGTE